MSKISTYEVAPVPKLSDKLIGTSVGGEIEDITYNFTLLELLELFLPVIPANNLQGVLDYGNTATQDINLFGTITTTNLEVTDTANLFITYLNEETHIVGSLFDSADSVGTAGQVLTSTGEGVEWFTLPPIFTPNLQQVLEEGNTADLDIILDADLEAINITADTANIATQLSIQGTVVDYNESAGTSGQVLESTVTGVQWVNLPVYSATSPLLFDSGTNTFSIQVANSTQGGYLTANDWVTFDGKQNAGAYITALTGEATATGPGSVPITLNNASVIAKVLTGLNITGGSISATDSILTAFGKVQNQINGLMGGVQYQGVWDAATNTPTLTSSVGTQGHYYIVNVAGTTNLNGITDWKVGDWAIFSGGTWQKVDNTESVTSVNGQTGAVSLTTDNIPEGATNLYYLDSRARAALSFAAGSGAYNSLTGVITIPTNNNQILNGANYITLSSISATSPLAYNNLTGVFSIQQADATHDGYLSSTDWSTFNNKQNYLGGTGLVKSTAGTITYITDNSGNWNTAYNRSIVSAAVTGTTTKTLTLNEQDGNTITASWTDLDIGLTSVGVSMPSAFSVANSPLTSNGTIAVTGAGTTLEYIDGTGALRTFPGLTGYVPYTGATTNVDLGEFGISAGYFQADLTPTGALQVGRMQWNSTDGTMDLRLLGNNVTLQIGQENVTRVVNKSGIDLLEANYQVVRVRKVAEGGAQGQRLAVVLAQGNNENNSTEVLGLVTETINVNQEGFVTAFGEVKEINTTGSLQGETWVDGDILYVSTSVAGQLTNIRPVAPNHAVTVGYVTYAHAVHGKIYMAIDTGYELGELHNVYAPSPTANQSIYWDTTNSRYQLNTIGGILGYTPANDALVVHLAGTETITGQKTFTNSNIFSSTLRADNGISFLTNGLVTNGAGQIGLGAYLGGLRTAFNGGYTSDLAFQMGANYVYTFPAASGTIALVGGAGVGTVTSVAALTLGTSGTDLSSTVANPTTTPVITLNVPTASAANRGALSAADWSTFNTKVGSVTASSPLASSGGQTPNITIQQSSGSQDGYLSSTDWTTFNNKQAAGNYITSLTGEATGTGPGATAVTLNNASVTAKVLTGINITGGTVQATDTMLTAFGKLQNQINGLVGGSIYQGTWNAATNTPALASGVGTKGYYYIVSVAGTTNLDGITDWFVGDWAIFDGTAWQQVDNTDAVVSVNGQTGAVSLTTDNIPEGATNQYFLNSRARAALSFTAGSGAYNSTTGVITIPTNNNQITNGANYITLASLSGTAPIVYSNTTGAISITQAGTASNGYLSSTDWNTFNNKQPAGSYVTLTGVETLSNKTFSNVVNLSVNGFILAGVTGVNPLQMYSTTLTSNFLFSSNSFGTNINNDLFYSKDSNNKSVLSFNNTAERTYTFPNASGTIALTSDIPSVVGVYLPLAGGTMTGVIGSTVATGTAPFTIASITLIDNLNADLLDGYHATRFAVGQASNITTNAEINDNIRLNGMYRVDPGVTAAPYDSYWSLIQYGNTNNVVGQLASHFANGETYIRAYNSSWSAWRKLWDNSNLPNPASGSGTVHSLARFTASTTIGDSAVTDNGTTIVLGRATSTLAVATEANSITITQPAIELDKPVKLLNFNWYDEPWSIGNIRSASAPSNGLGIFATSVEKVRFQTNAVVLQQGVNLVFRDNPYINWSSNYLRFRNVDNSIPVVQLRANGTATQAPRFELFNAADTSATIVLNGILGSGVFNSSLVSTDYRYTGNGYLTYNTDGVATNTFILRNNGTTVLDFDSSNNATFVGSVKLKTTESGEGLIILGRSDDFGILRFKNAAGTSNKATIYTNPSNLTFDVGSTAGAVTITSAGLIGFGNTNPQARLDLGGSYGASGEKFFIYNDNNTSALAGTKVGFYMDRFGLANNSTYVFPTSAANAGSYIISSKDTSGTTLVARMAVFGETGWISIGKGSSSPYSQVEIQATDSSGARTSPIDVLTITAENPSNPYNGFGATLLFRNRIYAGGPTPGGIRNGARIRTSINNNSSADLGTELVFDVTTTGAGALTEILRLSYDNGVTINSSATINSTLFVTAANGVSARFKGDGAFDGANRFYITNNAYIYGRNNLVITGRLDNSNDGYSFGTNSRNSIVFNINEGGAQGAVGTEYYGMQLQLVTKALYFQSKYGNDNGLAGFVFSEDNQLRIRNTASYGNYALQVTGTIYASGDVIAYSDISVKKNIRPIENALERVTKSRGIIYDRKDIDSKDNIGFIAQELELQFPELISLNIDGTKGVKYQNAVAVLFEAIKEQQKQIEELKNRN